MRDAIALRQQVAVGHERDTSDGFAGILALQVAAVTAES
jgi:hypothetical protein